MWEKIQNSMVDESNKDSSIRIAFYASLVVGLIFAIGAVVLKAFGLKGAGDMAWNAATAFSIKSGIEGIVAQWKSASVKKHSGSLQPAPPPTPDPSGIKSNELPGDKPTVVEVRDSKRLSEICVDRYEREKVKIRKMLAQVTLAPPVGELPKDHRPSFLLAQKRRKDSTDESEQQ